MNQILESQQTPHTSPLRASYGVSIVRIWDKFDRVITALHCIEMGIWLLYPIPDRPVALYRCQFSTNCQGLNYHLSPLHPQGLGSLRLQNIKQSIFAFRYFCCTSGNLRNMNKLILTEMSLYLIVEFIFGSQSSHLPVYRLSMHHYLLRYISWFSE